MKLRSPVFEDNGIIPRDFTCEGSNESPPLYWSEIPQGTRTFALLAEDPDAPGRTFVHWLLYNIPALITALEQNQPANLELLNGARHGINDFKRPGYGGPCPPSGTHRYFFKLFALDAVLTLAEGGTKQQLLKAMEGHILSEAQLMGRYTKGGGQEQRDKEKEQRKVQEAGEESFPASDAPAWRR